MSSQGFRGSALGSLRAPGGPASELLPRPSKVPFLGIYLVVYVGGCQNYGPFLGPRYNTAPII